VERQNCALSPAPARGKAQSVVVVVPPTPSSTDALTAGDDEESRFGFAAALAFERQIPLVNLWAMGMGNPLRVETFRKRVELQLLILSPEELCQKVSPARWRWMDASGLEEQEMLALIHCLRRPGAPEQAGVFVTKLQEALRSFAQSPRSDLADSRLRAGSSASKLGLPGVYPSLQFLRQGSADEDLSDELYQMRKAGVLKFRPPDLELKQQAASSQGVTWDELSSLWTDFSAS